MTDTRVIVFTCNWEAYTGLEDAGRKGLAYPPAVISIRVPCLGRLHPGIILEAFQRGAGGVLLLGCGTENCHYQFGSRQAADVVNTTGRLLDLLGYGAGAVQMKSVKNGDGNQWVERVNGFLKLMDSHQESRRTCGQTGHV